MSLISTRGAASARGFGLFAASAGCCLNDGNKAIFALGGGGNTTVRNKYTYATCASTACGVAAQSFASSFQSAAGNNTRGIFALGEPQGSGIPSNTRDKYTYSGCTSTSSGVGTASIPAERGAAAGNNTRGIFALGARYCCGSGAFVRLTTRNKYTYASCTSTACCVAAASVASQRGSAAGNSTRGIFTLGCGCGATTTRNKYTYASCTSTASGVASASATGIVGSAAGNSTRGIFALGRNPCTGIGRNTRNKYTYACCTSTASGVAVSTYGSALGSAAGNSTRGIFAIGIASCCGSGATRDKYTYACCTSTASGVGAASNLNNAGSAASWATCVNT
jgi:hypothetical protein